MSAAMFFRRNNKALNQIYNHLKNPPSKGCAGGASRFFSSSFVASPSSSSSVSTPATGRIGSLHGCRSFLKGSSNNNAGVAKHMIAFHFRHFCKASDGTDSSKAPKSSDNISDKDGNPDPAEDSDKDNVYMYNRKLRNRLFGRDPNSYYTQGERPASFGGKPQATPFNHRCRKDHEKRLLAARFEVKRKLYKAICEDPSLPSTFREKFRYKLSMLPRNSSFTRVRNRCIFTGRSRGVYAKFRLSRITFRELASQGLIHGILKASW